MGLDDAPLTEVWADWTPADHPPTPALAGQADAFDHWEIRDEAFVEATWASIFGVLDTMRRTAPADQEEAFRTLLTVLEPGWSSTPLLVDVTFVVTPAQTERQWEGTLLRIARTLPNGLQPTVSVLSTRRPGDPPTPRRITVWLSPGANEAPAFSRHLIRRQDASWGMFHTDGLTLEGGALVDVPDSALIAQILVEASWRRFALDQYVSSAHTDTPAGGAPPGGLVTADRSIDQVFSDTAFAPRITDFPSLRKGP